MSHSLAASATALLLALPTAMAGQSRASVPRDTVPLSMSPPAGKCRIWMDGVPAAQQPAPTDCTTALRQRPANGTILYGPASRETSRGRFDPRAGDRTPSRAGGESDSLDRGGSKAERELRRRRDDAERDKGTVESRERSERAQQAAVDRVGLVEGDAASRGGPSAPANSRAGGGTAKGTTKPPTEPAPKPPAGPAKKKPE